MKLKMRLHVLGLIAILLSPAQAGLEDKLASSNAGKREKALKKLEALSIQEKLEIFNSLEAKFNEVSQNASSSPEAMAIRSDLGRGLAMISNDILNDPDDKSYRVYAGVCETLGSLGPLAAPAISGLIKMLHYRGHPTDVVTALNITDDGLSDAFVYVKCEKNIIKIGAPAVPALMQAVETRFPAILKGEIDLNPDHVKGDSKLNELFVLDKIPNPEGQSFARRFWSAWYANEAAITKAKKKQEQDAQVSDENEAAATRKAADGGDAEAQNNLGVMYYRGKATDEAFKWFSKAFAQGNEVAGQNLSALLRDEIKEKMLAEDVKWGKRPLNFMMPLPDVMGKLYYREGPLWVFVDSGWEFSSAYSKREYVSKLLAIVRRYPLKIDAITIRRWDDDNHVRELTYSEEPWTKVIFGDTTKTMTAESIAPHLPKGLTPVTPLEAELESDESRPKGKKPRRVASPRPR